MNSITWMVKSGEQTRKIWNEISLESPPMSPQKSSEANRRLSGRHSTGSPAWTSIQNKWEHKDFEYMHVSAYSIAYIYTCTYICIYIYIERERDTHTDCTYTMNNLLFGWLWGFFTVLDSSGWFYATNRSGIVTDIDKETDFQDLELRRGCSCPPSPRSWRFLVTRSSSPPSSTNCRGARCRHDPSPFRD